MADLMYVTSEGYDNLKKELHKLKNVDRPAIIKAISEARDKGDLSENAEYHAAKEAQGLLEMKIAKLEATISNARLIDESVVNISTISILNRVKIKNLKNNAIVEYQIVSESEANLKQGKIAVNSPIAKGLLGKKVGDIVDIKVPIGIISFEILSISI